MYTYFAQGLPDPSAIETKQERFETVKIYDRTGQHLLYESIDPRPKLGGDRTYLRIDQIPEMMRNATIALEDRDPPMESSLPMRQTSHTLFSGG